MTTKERLATILMIVLTIVLVKNAVVNALLVSYVLPPGGGALLQF
jgi:hypothetical protein